MTRTNLLKDPGFNSEEEFLDSRDGSITSVCFESALTLDFSNTVCICP